MAQGEGLQDFYVGIPGDLTGERRAALEVAGIRFTDMGKTAEVFDAEPTVDRNKHHWIKFPATDEQDARTRVARALAISAADLIVEAPRP